MKHMRIHAEGAKSSAKTHRMEPAFRDIRSRWAILKHGYPKSNLVKT